MDDIGGVWRTIGGRRVFIKDGEDLSTAMKNSGKFKSVKDIEHQKRKISHDIDRNMYDKEETKEKWKEYDALEKLEDINKMTDEEFGKYYDNRQNEFQKTFARRIADGEDEREVLKEASEYGFHPLDVKRVAENIGEERKNGGEYNKLEKLSDSKVLNGDYSKSTDKIRDIAKNLYKELNYDEKPQLVDDKEYKALKEKGYKEIYRGIRGYGVEGKNGDDFVEQYKNGELFIGSQRVFGSGTYYTYEDDAKNTVARFSNSDGATMNALLRKDTKVISSNKLNELKTEYSKKMLEKATELSKTNMDEASKYYDKMNKVINMDNGIFASTLGYEAIDVEDAKYIVSLNRGKLIIKK